MSVGEASRKANRGDIFIRKLGESVSKQEGEFEGRKLGARGELCIQSAGSYTAWRAYKMTDSGG